MLKTIEWKNDQVIMIDQRKLPLQEKYVICKSYRSVIRSIRDLVIWGAPAIGVAAAMGVALGALKIRAKNMDQFNAKLNVICEEMLAARPTAVNLAWAVERMQRVADAASHKGLDAVKSRLVRESPENAGRRCGR